MGASITPGSASPSVPSVMERYKDTEYIPGMGLVAPGHLGRDHRQQVGHQPRGARRLRLRSQERAAQAPDEGRFDNEIIPVAEKRTDKETGELIETGEMVTSDEGIRPTRAMEKLAKLKPAFLPEGKVTAGNSLADHRRRLRHADHERGEGQGARPQAPRQVPHLRPRRRRSRS